MTPKQMALSRLARLALSAEAESSPLAKCAAFQTVAAALQDECPDLANLARQAASSFSLAIQTEQEFFTQLQF